MGQFRHHHSGKTRTMALFWLRTSYHAQRYMFQRYMLRSLLTQSFNNVNTPMILLFSKKWVPGFAAEDNMYHDTVHAKYPIIVSCYLYGVMPHFWNVRSTDVHPTF